MTLRASLASVSALLAIAGLGMFPASAQETAADCKIALLLPQNHDHRFDHIDRPFFTDRVKEKAPQCEVLYYNAANDPVYQQQQAETAMTLGATVLVLDVVNQESAATIVSQAKARGIPTIAHDRVTSGPIVLRVTFDNIAVGRLQAETLIKGMQERGDMSGDIVMINGEPSSTGSQNFRQGAHSVLDSSPYTIAAEYDTIGWSPETAATQMTQAITRVGRDNIKGVYVANDTMAGASINAMQQAGMDPVPPVTGQDANVDALQRILLGTQYMTIYKPLRQLNYAAADAAVAYATGQTFDAGTATQKNASGDEYPVITIEPLAVTADTIKETIVADNFADVNAICTEQVMAACKEHGLVE